MKWFLLVRAHYGNAKNNKVPIMRITCDSEGHVREDEDGSQRGHAGIDAVLSTLVQALKSVARSD